MVCAVLDYTRWERWLKAPDDPVSREEAAAKQVEGSKVQDDAFERANPDFCAHVRGDVERRQSSEASQKHESDRESVGDAALTVSY